MTLDSDTPGRRALFADAKRRFARAACAVDIAWLMSWMSAGFLLIVSVFGAHIGFRGTDQSVVLFALWCGVVFCWAVLCLVRYAALRFERRIPTGLLRGEVLDKGGDGAVRRVSFRVDDQEALEGELPMDARGVVLTSSTSEEVFQSLEVGKAVTACVMMAERGALRRYTEMVLVRLAPCTEGGVLSEPAAVVASSR
jgi:hypothetical protein